MNELAQRMESEFDATGDGDGDGNEEGYRAELEAVAH